MNLEAQRATHTKARDRRAWLVSALMLVAITVALYTYVHFPRHGTPMHVRAQVTLLLTVSIVGGNLFYERADAWQRSRALSCFALGAVTGIAWLAVECVEGGRIDPGYPLAAISMVWLVSDVLFRMLPSMRAGDGEDA